MLFTFLGIYLLIVGVNGYKFLWTRYVFSNLEVIRKYPYLSYDEKMRIKLHRDYDFVMYVKRNTPDSAVIVMPPLSVKSIFRKNNGARSKLWDEYFLYPRKLVYADEKNNPLLEKGTHIMIMNTWGYDYLEKKYGIKYTRRDPYTVLPIKVEKR